MSITSITSDASWKFARALEEGLLSDHEKPGVIPEKPALNVSRPQGLSLRTMTGDQRKRCVQAMLCAGAGTSCRIIEEITRSAAGILSGVELSGILRAQNTTFFNLTADGKIYYAGGDVEPFSEQVTVTSAPISIQSLVDNILSVPIDTMTYAAVGSWVVSHTFSPSLQEYFKRKENGFISQLILPGSNAAVQNEVSLETLPPDRNAKKFSFLIEYAMPFLFDASRAALFIRMVQQAEHRMKIPGGGDSEPLDMLPGYIEATLGVLDAIVDMVAGDLPVPNAVLYVMLTLGLLGYGVQAYLNFLNNLQTKAAQAATVTPIIDLESEDRSSPATLTSESSRASSLA